MNAIHPTRPTATRLLDGRVLMVGGFVDGPSPVYSPAEVYMDPNLTGTLGLTYSGTQSFPAGTTVVDLKAVLAGAPYCADEGAAITFSWDSDADGTYDTVLGTTSVDNVLAGTYTWTLPSGVTTADIQVSFDGPGDCGSVTTTAIIQIEVAASGGTSMGGGYYDNGGRVDFGYVAQASALKNTASVRGEVLWQKTGQVRVKGLVSGYKKLSAPPSQTPNLNGTVAAEISGTASLHTWEREPQVA